MVQTDTGFSLCSRVMALTDPPATAGEIVRAAGSNLAFALAVLPRDRRDDMRVFYAFCRVVDDIVDSETAASEEKSAALDRWRALVRNDAAIQPSARPGLEQEMLALCEKRQLPVQTLIEIIDGVAMDLDRNRYETFEELQHYCHGVASAVGLVSIEVFGYQEAASREYAEQLGYALQLTNILRDVGEDAAENRIYLPLEDLRRFGLDESDILNRVHDERFDQLMAFECERAEAFYAKAVAALPEVDRPSMRSAELMRAIYGRILTRMKTDGFRVFEKRYRLGKLEMLTRLIRAWCGRP